MPVNYETPNVKETPFRVMIQGESKTGKTRLALSIATALVGANPESICIYDTENRASSAYAEVFKFKRYPTMIEHQVVTFKRFLTDIHRDGFKVGIIDSLTTEWRQGVLGRLDAETSKKGGNTWAAWSVLSPLHENFLLDVQNSPLPVIIGTVKLKEKQKQVGSKIIDLPPVPDTRKSTPYVFSTIIETSKEWNEKEKRFDYIAQILGTWHQADFVQDGRMLVNTQVDDLKFFRDYVNLGDE